VNHRESTAIFIHNAADFYFISRKHTVNMIKKVIWGLF